MYSILYIYPKGTKPRKDWLALPYGIEEKHEIKHMMGKNIAINKERFGIERHCYKNISIEKDSETFWVVAGNTATHLLQQIMAEGESRIEKLTFAHNSKLSEEIIANQFIRTGLIKGKFEKNFRAGVLMGTPIPKGESGLFIDLVRRQKDESWLLEVKVHPKVGAIGQLLV